MSQASGLEPIETASRDELTALQIERLQVDAEPRLRATCPTTAPSSTPPASIPTTSRPSPTSPSSPSPPRQDLRDNYPFGLFAVPRDEIARVHASSGTTGQPTVVGYSRRDLDTWADVMARSMRAAGCRPGMMVHVAYGYGLFTGGLGAHYGAERLGCAVVPVSGGMTERQVQLIADFKPDIVMVTPSYMLAILDEMRRIGRRPAQMQPEDRHVRRRAVDQRDARRDRARARHRRARHLRPVGSDRPRRRQRMRRDQGRPDGLGGPFLSRDRRSRDRRCRSPTASTASWCSPR